MTLDQIRAWYEANKVHTMYKGHWCRTCSIGVLLDTLDQQREDLERIRNCPHVRCHICR